VWDCNLTSNKALFLVVGLPVIAYLLGLHDALTIISFLGAIFTGFEGVLIMLMYRKVRQIQQRRRQPAKILRLPYALVYCLIGIFAIGIVYQIYYFIR